MIDPGLEGKVVLITGANHGIGEATVRRLANLGANVFITYYRQDCDVCEKRLQKERQEAKGGCKLYRAMQQQGIAPLLQDIEQHGGTAYGEEADLSDVANIPKLFELCEHKLGPVDILINNHTYCEMETFDPELESD